MNPIVQTLSNLDVNSRGGWLVRHEWWFSTSFDRFLFTFEHVNNSEEIKGHLRATSPENVFFKLSSAPFASYERAQGAKRGCLEYALLCHHVRKSSFWHLRTKSSFFSVLRSVSGTRSRDPLVHLSPAPDYSPSHECVRILDDLCSWAPNLPTDLG